MEPQPAPPRRWFWSDAIFFTALVLVCGLAAFIGLAPLRLFQHDIFFLLDNGYRVLQGQVPHRDFSSAWGPLTFLIEAAGMKLSNLGPAGVGYSNALFGALAGLWAWRIARGRLRPGAACLLGIYTVLLIAAPFSLGWGAMNFSYAMVYNRYGFALLGIVVVECAAGKRTTFGAISTGAALALLAFLKITYAIMAVPFILLALVWGTGRGKRLLALCGACAVVAALFLGYLRFDLPDVLRDLAMAASGRGHSWRPSEIFTLGLRQVADIVPLLLLAAVLRRGRTDSSYRGYVIAFLTVAVGTILLSTNHQPASLPLSGFAAIVLADTALCAGAWQPYELLVAVLMAASVLPLCLQNGASLVGAAMEERRPVSATTVRLASERGASMLFGPVPVLMTTETGGPAYVIAINDGLALLGRHTGSRDGVLAIDMLNPFNYLLDRPSPRGGLAAAAYNYVISAAAHPSPGRFFGDARYVLVRKYSRAAGDYDIENFHVEGIRRIYQPALQERFHLIEETGHWLLWGR